MNKVLALQPFIDPYLPCSAAIKFHNITETPTYQTDHIHVYHTYTIQTQLALLMDSSFCIQARQTISAMLSRASTLYIAVTHNITHSPCISTMHSQHYPPHCLHNPLHTTKKHAKHVCVSGCKLAQDVGMV